MILSGKNDTKFKEWYQVERVNAFDISWSPGPLYGSENNPPPSEDNIEQIEDIL